jgi:hypothetical protein
MRSNDGRARFCPPGYNAGWNPPGLVYLGPLDLASVARRC